VVFVMHIRSLEAFGLSPRLLEVWERVYGPELLPAQAAALQQTNLRRGGSLILFAPTGAGKTLVGEMAALQAVTQGRRALYLVPTKALAEEKFALLRQNYAALGLRVVISTRDRRYDDPALLRGDFDLAVAVPEKAHYLLNLSPGIARAIGCVVVDELQMIAEPERGATLEMTLAHLLAAAPEVQIVGLSAVVDNPGPLAEWLRAEWLEVRERPVELRQGVCAGGVFRYRGQNSGEPGEERWDLPATEEGWEPAAAALALELAGRGEPTLVFLRDRRSVERLALRLADASSLPPGTATLERLAALPPTFVRRRLQETASAGIGFHSSDLQFEDRRILEEGFAAGEIAILCSTSTLAVGINLPAKNVILQGERWQRSPGEGRSVLEPLGRGEFENMGGRAGRPGRGEAFGRAILLAESEFQAEALLARYVRPEFEPLHPALERLAPLAQLALLCGGGEDAAGALALYRHTFTAQARGEQAALELPPALAAALRSAVKYGLLAVREPAETLEITPLGRLAAVSGAGLEGFYWLLSHLAGAEPPGLVGLLYLAATAPEAADLGLPACGPAPGWWEALVSGAQAEDLPLLAALREAPERSVAEKTRAARLVLALLAWTSEADAEEIEEAAGVPVGRLAAAAETASWLVHLCGQIGALQGWPEARVQATERWSAQLAAGLPAEALPLYHALHGVAGRDRILALLGAGLRSLQDLQARPVAELRRLLPEAEWREIPALQEAFGMAWQPAPRPLPLPVREEAPAPSAAPGPVLCLDAGRPDRVLFYGQPVPLRPAEFKLLAALAAEPGRCLSYDRLYAALWGPEELVEPGQIHWHRSKLAERLRRALPEGTPFPLRTVPRRGFLLDLRPDEVRYLAA
jgi:helicase